MVTPISELEKHIGLSSLICHIHGMHDTSPNKQPKLINNNFPWVFMHQVRSTLKHFSAIYELNTSVLYMNEPPQQLHYYDKASNDMVI